MRSNWPGLGQQELYKGRDLADVLAEAVVKHLGNRDVRAVFPGYAASGERFRGWLKDRVAS